MTALNQRIRPFDRSDLERLDLLEERDIVVRDREVLHSLGESTSEDAFCGTVLWNGEPAFVGGWKRMPRAEGNTVRAFIIPSIKIFQHPIRFTKTVLKWLRKIEAMPEVDRVITLSRCNGRIDSWMECLGFKCETTLKRYVDGYDYRLWVRSKEGK